MLKNILDFLNEHKLSHDKVRDTDSHVQLNCPLCTDSRKRLGIKVNSGKDNKGEHPWHCFNCGAKGRKLATLKKAMTDLKTLNRKTFVEFENEEKSTIPQGLAEKCHDILYKEDKQFALDYLMTERGLSEETIKHFKIGFRAKFKSKDGNTYDAGPHISLPGYENEKCVYLKYRSIDPDVDKKRKWRREVGCKTVLFNDEVLQDHEYDEVFIAEAEIDCMSMWSNSFKNSIGLTAGADTFENMQEWYDKLERFKKIYLVMDNDEAGQLGARKIAKRLGLGRTYNIELPSDTKDPNDYFKKYSPKDFTYLKEKAKLFNPDDVETLHQMQKDFLHELRVDTIANEGYTTGFPSIDKILGPLKPGNLIPLAARPKVGKTITVMNFLKSMCIKHNISSFNYQCEMEKEDMVKHYAKMTMHADKLDELPSVKRGSDGRPVFRDLAEKKRYEEIRERLIDIVSTSRVKLPSHKLISYHPQTPSELELDKVCQKITEVVQRFGCKIVVFDNLHFLCRGDKAKEMVDKTTQAFKMLARKLGVIFFVVTHPKKTNHNRELENDDLKESGAIFQDADAVILLHRAYTDDDDVDDDKEMEDENMLSDVMSIKVTARRHKGGRTKVLFNGATSSIIDSPKAKERDVKEKKDE